MVRIAIHNNEPILRLVEMILIKMIGIERC
jgi:hypothetical protein